MTIMSLEFLLMYVIDTSLKLKEESGVTWTEEEWLMHEKISEQLHIYDLKKIKIKQRHFLAHW